MNYPKYCLFLIGILLFVGSVQAQKFQIDPTKFFEAGEITKAHTALKEKDLTTEEKNVFLYTNLSRMYPQKFAAFFKEYVKTRDYLLKDYNEGNTYFVSLEKELKNSEAIAPLWPDSEMYQLAECWATESGKSGLVGHDRVDCQYGYQGENCSYGYSGGLDIVMQLLVDKDVKSLGHRKAMLNPEFQGMGVAIRFHKNYTNTAVQNFSKTNDQLRKLESKKETTFTEMLNKWSSAEQEAAKVCDKLDYLNDIEKDIYFLVNMARLYPQRFKKEIWDQWEEFGPELSTGEVDHLKGYKEVSEYLSYAAPREVYLPAENVVKESRCVSNRWIDNDPDYEKCFTSSYSWRLDTYYPEDAFKDRLNFLTEPEGGNMLILANAVITIVQKELYNVKTIIVQY